MTTNLKKINFLMISLIKLTFSFIYIIFINFLEKVIFYPKKVLYQLQPVNEGKTFLIAYKNISLYTHFLPKNFLFIFKKHLL